MKLKKIKTRVELIYMLCEAAEIEHQLLLVYLFAAFSLKTHAASANEFTPEQLKKIRSWKRRIVGVAIEEMCHLSMVSNLLTSIGGAPHFARPNIPQDTPKYYPPGFSLDLQAFSRESLQRFVAYENPNNPEMNSPEFKSDAEHIKWKMIPNVDDDCQIVEEDLPFHTIHDLYDCIQGGFENLWTQNPDTLFIGGAQSQLTNSKQVRLFEEMIPIVELKSVRDSIKIILEQGEGNTGNLKGHFRIFCDVLAEYEAELKSCEAQGKKFSPAHDCIENPFIHQPADASEVNLIDDEFTSEISLLFNASYDLMMKMIIRTFNHHEETIEEVGLLVDVFISFMHDVMSPLGELLCQLPAGKSYPGKNAGPSFEYPRDMHLLPHKECAWIIFSEQLNLISKFTLEFSNDTRASVAAKETLTSVAQKMSEFSMKLKG